MILKNKYNKYKYIFSSFPLVFVKNDNLNSEKTKNSLNRVSIFILLNRPHPKLPKVKQLNQQD
jgi:hypothetical protein